MRALPLALGAGVLVLAVGIGLSPAGPGAVSPLKPVSDFSDISNEKDRSIALFTEAGKVIQHPRCVNCHPAGDRPQQRDDGASPPATRGARRRRLRCHRHAVSDVPPARQFRSRMFPPVASKRRSIKRK